MSPTRRRRSSNRGGQRPTAAQVRDFWGDDSSSADISSDGIVEPNRLITPGVDPTALVESLGPLPFPGGGVAAQHYFKAVYERAAGLAVALAAAAGLLELSPSGEVVDDAEWDDDDAP